MSNTGLVSGWSPAFGSSPVKEEVADAERRRPHYLTLQRDAVFVTAGDLQDRLDAGAEEKARCGQRAHMCPRAGAVGDINRVGEALEPRRLLQELGRVARHRWRQFGSHDESAVAQAVLQSAGEGGAVLVHRGHSAYMLYWTNQTGCELPTSRVDFWTGKRRVVRQWPTARL